MISSHTAVTATIPATDEETPRMLLNTNQVADPEPDSSTEASNSTNHSSGTDSGYASVENDNFCNSFEGTPLPGSKIWSQKVKLKEYRREISQPVRNRFKDLIYLFNKPLRNCISKSQLGSRDISFQLKILGEDEASSKPWIFIQCDTRLSKKIKNFFKKPTIKSQYQTTASDPLLPSFSIFICEWAPQRNAASTIEIYGQSQRRIGLGSSSVSCSIKVIHAEETRLATIGGLIKILAWDNTHIFYGMTAGHVFATDEDDDGDCRSEDCNFSSDDDESMSSDEEDAFELDIPSHQSGGSSTATSVHDEKHPADGMVTWSILGRLLEASKPSDEDGRDFDWALFAIEDPLLYYSMVSTDPIHKLGEKGELCEPNPVNDETWLERDVFLSGGASGVKEGTMSTVCSYLNLEPGRSLIETYTVTFTDKTALRDGDCGAWVVDRHTHEVFGHVVASNVFGETYIVPLQDVFANIQKQLGSQSVHLPQPHEAATLYGAPRKPLELGSLQSEDYFHQKTVLSPNSTAQTDDRYGSMTENALSTQGPPASTASTDDGYPPMARSGSSTPGYTVQNIQSHFLSQPIPPILIGFGSYDQFTAALGLVSTLITSLHKLKVSQTKCKVIFSELGSLEDALLHVKGLELLNDDYLPQLVALRHTAGQCYGTVSVLCERIISLIVQALSHGDFSSISADTSILKKAHWDQISRDDLAKFQADLKAHSASIAILLMAIPSNVIQIDRDSTRQKPGTIQRHYFGFMQKLKAATEGLSSFPRKRRREIMDATGNIIRRNIWIFLLNFQIQKIATWVPGQVLRQQPVLIDALGRYMPIHLEFITSWMEFDGLLKKQFSNSPVARKVQRRDYLIQDSVTKRDIGLSTPWKAAFRPGQKIEMSMVLRFESSKISCRRCQKEFGIDKEEQNPPTECHSCSILFQDLVEILKHMRGASLEFPLNLKSSDDEAEMKLYGLTGMSLKLAYQQASNFRPRLDRRKLLNSTESATWMSPQSIQSNPHQSMIKLPRPKRKERKEKAKLAKHRQRMKESILKVEAVPASVAAKSQQKPQVPQKGKELPPRNTTSVSSIKGKESYREIQTKKVHFQRESRNHHHRKDTGVGSSNDSDRASLDESSPPYEELSNSQRIMKSQLQEALEAANERIRELQVSNAKLNLSLMDINQENRSLKKERVDLQDRLLELADDLEKEQRVGRRPSGSSTSAAASQARRKPQPRRDDDRSGGSRGPVQLPFSPYMPQAPNVPTNPFMPLSPPISAPAHSMSYLPRAPKYSAPSINPFTPLSPISAYAPSGTTGFVPSPRHPATTYTPDTRSPDEEHVVYRGPDTPQRP